MEPHQLADLGLQAAFHAHCEVRSGVVIALMNRLERVPGLVLVVRPALALRVLNVIVPQVDGQVGANVAVGALPALQLVVDFRGHRDFEVQLNRAKPQLPLNRFLAESLGPPPDLGRLALVIFDLQDAVETRAAEADARVVQVEPRHVQGVVHVRERPREAALAPGALRQRDHALPGLLAGLVRVGADADAAVPVGEATHRALHAEVPVALMVALWGRRDGEGGVGERAGR
mmetsp:Transcript_130356/g.325187  ORF Transcript_130356/g.325187 Transcript_130356/m.325187 type:complete len:231 (-) Transcript_130356:160-852(-)